MIMSDRERGDLSFRHLNLKAIALALIPHVSEYKGGEGEGTSVIPRPLWMQEILLRFNANLLNDRTILNFGCGRDVMFMKGLDEKGVKPKKVWRIDTNPALERNGVLIADGKGLSEYIAPRCIDISLALFVMHQIPFPDRVKVYEELLKVTDKALHIGPVFKSDFDLLQERWLKARGFTMLVCHPFQQDDGFMPTDISDYHEKIQQKPKSRIQCPERMYPVLIRALGMRHLAYEGGSYMVLARNDFLRRSSSK